MCWSGAWAAIIAIVKPQGFVTVAGPFIYQSVAGFLQCSIHVTRIVVQNWRLRLQHLQRYLEFYLILDLQFSIGFCTNRGRPRLRSGNSDWTHVLHAFVHL